MAIRMNAARIKYGFGFGILRRQLGWLVLTIGLAWLPRQGLPAQPSAAPEYNVKAAFLTLFSRYTTWPTNTFAATNSPIVIGVLGADPLGEVLVKTAALRSGEHPLQVRHLPDAKEADGCQVVFISRAEAEHEADWIAELRGKPILIVGESGHTLERGGVLEFKIVDGRIRFNLSWPALQQADLQISSQMLQSAQKIFKTREEMH